MSPGHETNQQVEGSRTKGSAMRLIAIAAVLALTASPALACGPGGPSRAAPGLQLKTVKVAKPSKAELQRRAAAIKAEEAEMLKQGYVKCCAGPAASAGSRRPNSARGRLPGERLSANR